MTLNFQKSLIPSQVRKVAKIFIVISKKAHFYLVALRNQAIDLAALLVLAEGNLKVSTEVLLVSG
jgi:hypothetical protein